MYKKLIGTPTMATDMAGEMKTRSALGEYTQQEFELLIRAIEGARTEQVLGELLEHFNKVVPHPAGSDLLFYPENDADGSVNGVVKAISDYCFSNGLPGFKDD